MVFILVPAVSPFELECYLKLILEPLFQLLRESRNQQSRSLNEKINQVIRLVSERRESLLPLHFLVVLSKIAFVDIIVPYLKEMNRETCYARKQNNIYTYCLHILTKSLSKTNLYIRGLNTDTSDKDLVNMCKQ